MKNKTHSELIASHFVSSLSALFSLETADVFASYDNLKGVSAIALDPCPAFSSAEQSCVPPVAPDVFVSDLYAVTAVALNKLDRNVVGTVRADVAISCHAIAALTNPTELPFAGLLPNREPLGKCDFPSNTSDVSFCPLGDVPLCICVFGSQRQSAVKRKCAGLTATKEQSGVAFSDQGIFYIRHGSSCLGLGEVVVQQMLEEDLWMGQLHIGGDAASCPVLHPLHAAVFVKTKQLSQLCRPTHIGNKLLVAFEVVHDSIKRDV